MVLMDDGYFSEIASVRFGKNPRRLCRATHDFRGDVLQLIEMCERLYIIYSHPQEVH